MNLRQEHKYLNCLNNLINHIPLEEITKNTANN